MPHLTPQQLLAELEVFALQPPNEALEDADVRAKLYALFDKAKKLLETPTELVTRLLLSQHVEGTVIDVALDLELFSKLEEENGSTKTLETLASSIKVEPALLKRLLRALAAFGAVQEVEHDGYRLSPSHSILANNDFGHAVVTVSEILHPTYQALPQYLKSRNYATPTDPKNTVIQQVFGIKDKDMMSLVLEKPDWARGFGMLMSTWGESHALLQHLYPVKERLVAGFNADINPVLFLDVGGGYGQKSIALRQAFPDLPGKVVVQDMPVFIDTAPVVEGIDFTVHDFFTEQPVKTCVKILSMLRPSLKPGYSKLLIHELIVPETGASTWAAVQDINMMSLAGVAERTEKDWKSLIHAAGLAVENIYRATDGVSESVIEVVVEEQC
ncbi:S-adenosyl-L-methionine-dependent methyltransferase [Lindgomyces ingoldianus]|uniref:S-adenosyl-L-methionine-dependent methyltransferase n=1 Tax=Lindgomyces ingoldianus TaxID=673940 RepID=A0ACB6Q8L5_9PLEO|nr:S-adenosyl-L-methionine-dependent methyltransferase [Lindgomyces ingoldianus]KAF2462880.1 S-adenosyl-L-methionine-dependent methyltransferase [Lindgomyces ingoldianus]